MAYQSSARDITRWDEVGPFTLDVAREATQTNGIPTQWSGRITAIAIDPRCDDDACRLYVCAAGGGVSEDWGFLRLPADGTSWIDASRGLPEVAVYELSQAHAGQGKRVIYAATHGRGGYRLVLGRD